ncbi:MAG: pitrilysin family protein [Clostridiales bacterium]
MDRIKRYKYEKINEEVLIYTHSSGLNINYIPKKGYLKKYATFSTHFGSINNSFKVNNENSIKVPDGVAHFLEHKLFEQEYGDVMDKFSILGADPNAYTSFSRTTYLFSCVDNFFENYELLLNFVQHLYLTDKSIEKEKGIIAQEIKMYRDNPHWRLFFNLLEGLYINHPVKIDIAGTVESINRINKDILYKCYNSFYNLSNMVITIVGDLDFEKIIEYSEANLKTKNDHYILENIYPKEPKDINKIKIEENLDVSSPIFQLGFKETELPRIGKGSIIYEMGISILQEIIFGKSSEFYNEMYEKNLLDNSFLYDYTVEKEFAFSTLGGESKNPELVRDSVVSLIKKLKKNRISREDFNRTKKAYYGKIVKNLNSIEKIASMFNLVYFRDINMFDYYELYDKITYELINDVLDLHFDENKIVLSLVKNKS